MKITIEVESAEADEFVQEITTSSDVFRRTHCGYWARGVEHSIEAGWLMFDEQSDFIPRDGSALTLWRRREKLPDGYYRLGHETAIKAWTEGAKKYGVGWFGDLGSEAWDYAIQMAIFGEVVYG